MPMDLLCRLQGENKRLTEERDALAQAIGDAVVKMGVAQAVPMTGPELIHMLESAAGAGPIPCTYPDCLSARAVQAAGEEVEKLRWEAEKMKGLFATIGKLQSDGFSAWLAGFIETAEYKADSFLWSDMAKAAYAAGGKAAYQCGYAEGLEKAAETALTFATAAQSPYQGRPVIPADIRAVVNVICRIAESIRSVAK